MEVFYQGKKKKKQAYYNAQVFRREDFSLHGGQGIDINFFFLKSDAGASYQIQ